MNYINLSQAIKLLYDYIDKNIGSYFKQLLLHAEEVKNYESDNDAEKRMDHLNQFCKILETNFKFSQAEIDELKIALEGEIDHFHNQFIKLVVKHYENPEFTKRVEDEIVETIKKLQEDPYNYPPEGLEHSLKGGLMFQFHWDRDEETAADEWGKLTTKFDPEFIKDADDEVEDKWIKDSVRVCNDICNKYKSNANFPYYILQLVNSFPYQDETKNS